MKFDKDTVLMIVLCVAIVVGWKPLCNYMGWFQAAPAAENVSAAAPAVKSIVTKRAIAETAVAVTTSGPAPVVKPTPDGKGEDKIHISKYIGDIIPCEDGTVWVTENWYIYNEETYVSENKIYLVKRELEATSKSLQE